MAAAAAEVAAAEEIIAIAASQRRAIVEHIQARREAERAANVARVQGEADAAQAIVDIEAKKRRALVLYIQTHREVERATNEKLVEHGLDLTRRAGESFVVFNERIDASIQALADGAKSAGAEGAGGFVGAWQEFGGWKGVMSGASAAVGAFATGGWKAGVMSMAQTAMNFLPPGMAQAAQAALAAVSAVWGAIKGLFGPSEAELAGREAFASFHAGAVEELGGTQRFADEVQVAINAGWGRTLAETRAGFILWGTDAGLTYDEAFEKYAQYQTAVGAGNTVLMEQLEAEFAGVPTDGRGDERRRSTGRSRCGRGDRARLGEVDQRRAQRVSGL